MAFIAKDKIVRTGDDLNLSTLVNLQADATVLGTVADAVGTVAFDRLEKIEKVSLTANAPDTGGGVLSWANPENANIVVTRLLIQITDGAAEATGTIDFGVAANGTTPSDTLIDGMEADVAGFVCNIKNGGTNGKSGATMSATQFLTGTASEALTSFAGVAYIHYVLA